MKLFRFGTKEDNELRLMKINSEIKYLESKTQHAYHISSNFIFIIILFFISFLLTQFIPSLNKFNMKILYSLIIPFILSIIFVYFTVKFRLNKKKIQKLIKSKEKIEEILLEELNDAQITDSLNKIDNYLKDINGKYLSSLNIGFWPRFFDRITNSNQYNSKVLVCPICNSNNGLSDNKDSIHYICPKCGNHVTATSKYIKGD